MRVPGMTGKCVPAPVLPAAAAAVQRLVHPGPGRHRDRAVPGLGPVLPDRGAVPGRGVGAADGLAVPGRLPGPRPVPGRRVSVEHPVRPDPRDQDHRQVSQQPGQPGHVVARVHRDQDGRVAVFPAAGRDQPGHDLPQLRRGHRQVIIAGPQPDRVQRQHPARRPRPQRGHHRVRPARDHLRGVLPPPVHMAEHPLRAGARVRPQPRRHVHRQPDPAVRPAAAAAPPGSPAAALSPPGPRSPRRTPRRARARTPAPATAAPGPSPAPARTAPHRPGRTAHPPARSGTGTARPGTPPAAATRTRPPAAPR